MILGTKIKTGGSTHAAYRAITELNSIRFIPPLALLIDPNGLVKQQIDIWPRDHMIEELEAATALKSAAP